MLAFHDIPQEVLWSRFRVLMHLVLLGKARKHEGVNALGLLEVNAII